MAAKRSVVRAAQAALKQDEKLRSKRTQVKDSFQNFNAQLGIGADPTLSASTYGFNPVSRIRTILEWVHRGSWLGGVAIDLVADDMTKMGVELRGDMEPDEIQQLDRAATTWQIWNSINDTIKWARLYGGALAVMMIDGQLPNTPLRLETVGKGQFKGLMVLDRWSVEPSLNDLITDFGPDLGLPKFYNITATGAGLPRMSIHHSRCLRLEGIRLPYQQRLMENFWGISIIERLWDRMVAFDSATTGAAQLIYKAYIRTYKIEGLREIVAAGGPSAEGLARYVDQMRRHQGIEGVTLLDTKDEFEPMQHSAFGGLAEMILQMGQQLSGALQIPLVRLFGQSPAGLNSTGESDLRTYYDGINQQQERTLKVPVTKIYRALAASEGINLPEGFSIDFKPLWQLTAAEKVQTAAQLEAAVEAAFSAGIINRATALEELSQGSKLTGVFTNITKEHIKEAEDEPPPGSLEAQAQGMELQNEMMPEPDPEGNDKEPKKTKDEIVDVHYTATSSNPQTVCGKCQYFASATCINGLVQRDPKVPSGPDGRSKAVSPAGWCEEFKSKGETV